MNNFNNDKLTNTNDNSEDQTQKTITKKNGNEFKIQVEKNNFDRNGKHKTDNQTSNTNTNIEENIENTKSERVFVKPEDKSQLLNDQNVVEVACQNKRKEIFYCPKELKISVNNWVVVETENGVDIGRVTLTNAMAFRKWELTRQSPVYSVKHKANQKELDRHKANLSEHPSIVKKVQELSNKLGLDIKITEAEWQLDHHRLTIYFLSPQRVDFRELVKELAKIYKTRIELRQITHRERARRIGCWQGVCGRQICCGSFLHQLKPITVEHAKIQQLTANVTKLSGYCGRLKCCLLYEYEYYKSESERYPKIGSILNLNETQFKLIKFDIFKEILTFYDLNNQIYKNFTLGEIQKFAQENLIIEPVEESQHYCQQIDGMDDNLDELIKISD